MPQKVLKCLLLDMQLLNDNQEKSNRYSSYKGISKHSPYATLQNLGTNKQKLSKLSDILIQASFVMFAPNTHTA